LRRFGPIGNSAIRFSQAFLPMPRRLGGRNVMKRFRSVLACALCVALTVVSGVGLAACGDMNSGNGASSSSGGSSGGGY
jgi:hypothetical protein